MALSTEACGAAQRLSARDRKAEMSQATKYWRKFVQRTTVRAEQQARSGPFEHILGCQLDVTHDKASNIRACHMAAERCNA